MGNDFRTHNFRIQTGRRTIDVSQALLYVIEVNNEMARATGVDLVSASTASVDAAGAVRIARELGLTGRAYVKTVGTKSYLILKGVPGQRAVLRGTRYLTTNPQVAHITISPKALASGAARMTGVAVIAYAGLRVVEAILSDKDERMISILGTIASDVAKFAIASGAGFLAAAAVGAITTIAAGPLIAAVFVGLATGVALDRIDREFGLTDKIVLALEKAADRVRSPFDEFVMAVVQWERSLIDQAIRNSIPSR
jgi:hypothetical protein